MKKKNIYIAGLLLMSIVSFAQIKDAKLREGDKSFEEQAYFKSIEIYEKVANDGYKSVELFEKLGDSYFFNGEYVKANIWYAKLFELSKDVDPVYFYRYSQTLKSVSDNVNSNLYLQQFAALNQMDSRSKYFAESKDYLSEIKDFSGRYTTKDAGINTQYSDFGTTILKDKIVFSSSRVTDQNEKKDNWTSDNYYSLYTALLGKDNTLVDAQLFATEIKSKYHESDPVFTKDGKTMYFTRSVPTKSKKKSKKSILLKIYKASLINDKWDDIIELGFNSDAYSCAHPALSPDDKILYFVSDMPGGYGDSDIYRLPVNDEMNPSKIVNVGPNVNTSGKESFPWIDENNNLYFASDGHLGLGGLDVFVTKMENFNYTSKVVNLGKPVNSQFDDFGFVKLKNSNSGFFTSNREDGIGKDDIYSFTEKILNSKIQGSVIDDETGVAIAGAVVNVYDLDHNLIATMTSDDSGKFWVDVDKTHYIKVGKSDYETKEIVLHLSNEDSDKEITVGLSKALKYLEGGKDLAKLLSVRDIQFDLNKFDIKSDSEVELQKIIQVLNEFPEMKITVKSYTDSRQSTRYNMNLSNKRAKSTREYLIAHGIAGNRIAAKGYGETNLLNKCADGVECTEDEHRVNRRSEFIIK